MEEIYFRVTKEEMGLDGIILYRLSDNVFSDHIVCGNILPSDKPYNKSVGNSILDIDDFETVSRDFVKVDFPYYRDWIIEEIPEDEVEDISEEIDYFLNKD